MDEKELEHIFDEYHKYYSEDFLKYTLYSVAKGLSDMHEMGLIHGQIKASNIICNSKG